jgi:Zn-dependent protease with chaperone function
MAGFYVLALAIVAALLWIPYAEWTYVHRVHLKIAALCIGGAATVLWAIVPRPDRFEAPGPRLDDRSHPDLFRLVRDVASATRQDLPSEVYLLNEVNAWVTHRGGVMGFGSRRVMGIGLPLLQMLSVAELKAIVAHEFGHYASGDVKVGPWIYKTRAAIGRAIEGVHGTVIEGPFAWYGRHFLRLTHEVSRQQEFIADRIAAEVAGATALASALRQVTALAPSFSAYLSTEVAPVMRAGFLPPIASGFGEFLRDERIAALSQRTIADAETNRATSELDTHPCLHDRLAALAPLGPGPAVRPAERERASKLLPDLERQATALLRFAVGSDTVGKLKPVTWDVVGDHVYAPLWSEAAKSWSAWLSRFTADGLPGDRMLLINAGSDLVDRSEENVTSDQRIGRATEVLAIGIATLLLDQGWRVTTAPGKPLVLARDGDVVDPFAAVRECAEGAAGAERWKSRCVALGIAGRKLGKGAAAAHQ